MTITLAPTESSTLLFDGIPPPRGLREDADTMSWSTFVATYAPSAGPLRLGQWQCAETDRPATQMGPRDFQATLALGDRIETASATANGPVAALTAMLYELGVAVEMLRFHQLQTEEEDRDLHSGHRRLSGRVGRWVCRRIRPGPPCRRSSPARIGCTPGSAQGAAARSACRPPGSVYRRNPSAADTRAGQLKAVAAQQPMQDRLDFQPAEDHADALVGAAAERRESVAVALVFGARFGEPFRVEVLRIGPQLGQPVIHAGPNHHLRVGRTK